MPSTTIPAPERAYVVVDVKIHDARAYEEYRLRAPATIAAYGGRYLARAGVTEVLEGDWQPGRFVIAEFPSLARLKAWYHSPEYQAIVGIRHANATSTMVVIEGVDPASIR